MGEGWSTTDNCGKKASVSKSKTQAEMKFGVGNRRQRKPRFGGIGEMRTHVGEINERHFKGKRRAGREISSWILFDCAMFIKRSIGETRRRPFRSEKLAGGNAIEKH